MDVVRCGRYAVVLFVGFQANWYQEEVQRPSSDSASELLNLTPYWMSISLYLTREGCKRQKFACMLEKDVG